MLSLGAETRRVMQPIPDVPPFAGGAHEWYRPPLLMVERPPGTDPDGILLTFPVAPEHAGMRLDRFIQSRIPRLSRTRAATIVRSCAFRSDGAKRRASERVRAGETVILVRPSFKEPNAPLDFGVLYEDAAVLVVDKPAGLPMHPTATYHRHTLTYQLRERYPERPPQPAHRLDRETSGVVVCGKTLDAERALKRAFERREVSKRYVAIAHGEIADDAGQIDLPLARPASGLHILMEVQEGGATAVTDYEVLERREGLSRVSLRPVTGRQHQLRVHLAALGHPIVGDKLYGAEGVAVFYDYIEADMDVTPPLLERLGMARQALHAAALTMPHPDSDQPLELESPLPVDMVALWRDGLPGPKAGAAGPAS